MGRWKDNGSGQAYYDPNDSGPDQLAAPPLSQGGGGGDPAQSGARPGYHYEWSGGVTGGKHEVPDNPSDPRTPPLMGKDILQGPGMGSGQGPYDNFPGQGQTPSGPWMPPVYGNGREPWGLGTLNSSIGQQGNVFGSGASMGALKSSRGGLLGGLFSGLGSLNGAAGNAIGPYGTPR